MKTKTTQSRRQRTGSALVFTLILIVVLALVGQGLLATSFHASQIAEKREDVVLAQCAADAGVERAIFLMNERLGGTWSDEDLPSEANQPITSVDSTYSFAVISDGGGGYLVEPSVGVSGTATRTIYAGLRIKSPFEQAILVRDTIELKAKTVVDAIDSRVSLSPSDVDETAAVGTISIAADAVSLFSGSTINGSVFVGPGGDIETVIKDLSGSNIPAYVLPKLPLFPVVTPPTGLMVQTPIDVKNATATITPAESGEYSYVDMDNSGILLAEDGDTVMYVTGDVLMGQGSEIIVAPDSTLTIYFDGDFIAGNSAGVNSENKVPAALRFYATGSGRQKVELKAKGDFYGVVYAPNADVLIHNSGDVYGAMVGDTFTMMNSGTFYYDAALKEVDTGSVGTEFKVTSWREE
jgi:hypothetical protein